MSKSIVSFTNLSHDIQAERARYAAERLSFHSFFKLATVSDIAAVLRGEKRVTLRGHGRDDVLRTLFHAQRRRPHRLWKLLLLSAFEAQLAERRALLSPFPDTELDALVVETFLGALDRPPGGQTLKMKVARLFVALEAALVARHAAAFGRVTEPPRSGVVCTASVDGDDDGAESGVA